MENKVRFLHGCAAPMVGPFIDEGVLRGVDWPVPARQAGALDAPDFIPLGSVVKGGAREEDGEGGIAFATQSRKARGAA